MRLKFGGNPPPLHAQSTVGLVLRFAIALLHLSSIIVGMVFQMITCFRRDDPYISWTRSNKTVTSNESTSPLQTNQTCEVSDQYDGNKTHLENQTLDQTCLLWCNINKEFITTLLFPDTIIVFLAIWVYCGSILNENSRFDRKNQYRLTNTKKFQPIAMYASISMIYIISSLSLNVFYIYIFGIKIEHIKQSPFASIKERYLSQYVLFNSNAIFVPLLIGLIGFDLLYIKIITGYIYRCQLIIFHLKVIKKEVEDYKSTSIDTTTEKIINKLNSSSVNTAAVILIAGFAATTCIFDLFDTINKSNCLKGNPDYDLVQFMQIVAVTSRSILWGWLILLPFLKAADVNVILSRIRSCVVMNNNTKIDNNISPDDPLNPDTFEKINPADVKVRLIGIAVDQGRAYFAVFLLFLVIMIGENINWYKKMNYV